MIPCSVILALAHLICIVLPSQLQGAIVSEFDTEQMQEIRSGAEREWSDFPAEIPKSSFQRQFTARVNSAPWTLSLRQQDVKESWTVSINGTNLGRLVRDENDLRCDFEIPPRLLKQSDNQLIINTMSSNSDEIRVGQIQIHDLSPKQLRRLATIEVVITDLAQRPIPGRVTIVDDNGTLIPVTALASSSPSLVDRQQTTDDQTQDETSADPALASRQGVIYTATGHAFFGVTPGRYRIYAGRGFEYSIALTDFTIQQGQHLKRTLQLEREVDTKGWIACDTHVHTVTHSGHGDCTLRERLVTLAGEGIELPIATDHNTQIDYTTDSQALGTSRWFTPVVGNEVTTKRGHFNVFPTSADAARPNHQAADWSQLFDSIFENPQVSVAILNHARDLHSGFRPFSPRHHVSLTGTNLDEFDRRFNAMELINSGAVQTDPMELFRDWCGLINHGLSVTPVGSSDSHDVSRYIVGQGRTYIWCDDSDPAALDIDTAVKAFLQGKVAVSYGLLAKLSAKQGHHEQTTNPSVRSAIPSASAGPGDLLTLEKTSNQSEEKDAGLQVTAEVLFPSWAEVTEVELWLNGRPWTKVSPATLANQPKQEQVTNSSADDARLQTYETPEISVQRVRSIKRETNRLSCNWTIPRDQLQADSWLTMVAKGPGIRSPHWPTAKPYQPDSIQFQHYVFSCTGPLKIDADGDGIFSSARDQALGRLESLRGSENRIDLDHLREAIEQVDPAVASQMLAIIRPELTDFSSWMNGLPNTLKTKIEPFERAWQESIRAGLEAKE